MRAYALWCTLACACGSGLPEEGRQARESLREALVVREVPGVTRAVRVAERWEGRDPDLDRLLGDAVANVLMRPDEGLRLLRAHPAPEQESWREAVGGAAIRIGGPEALSAAIAEAGLPSLPAGSDVAEQVTLRARSDPSIGWPDLVEAVEGCALVDAVSGRGLQELDLPSPPTLPEAARALGAVRVVVARAARAPGARESWTCATGDLVPGGRIPDPLPRNLSVVATDGTLVLGVRVHPTGAGPWAYGSNDAKAAARWIAFAAALEDGMDAEDPALRSRFGRGLFP